jgi:hypothetical protein
MATFGYTGDGNAVDGTNAYVLGAVFTFTGATGSTLGNGHVRVRDSVTDHANAILYLGLYANSSGTPTTLLATASLNTTVPTTQAWYTLTGASYSSLTNGTSYFVIVASNMGSGFETSLLNNTNTISYIPGTALPSPFGTREGTFTGQMCAYFDYTEPAGGSIIPQIMNYYRQLRN